MKDTEIAAGINEQMLLQTENVFNIHALKCGLAGCLKIMFPTNRLTTSPPYSDSTGQ